MAEINDIGKLVKEARKQKGYSARELAKLCDISHTEINNIEKGQRVKPAVLTLKAFEKYLDLDYKELATLVGYSEETVRYGDEDIVVSFERYDKKLQEFNQIKKILLHEIDKKRHLGMDIKEYYDFIFDYLKSLKDVDKTVLKKSEAIYNFLDSIITEFDEKRIDLSDK